jgi:pimeloyl-ACP methyl ester carboxylesterase/DNA-binding CsgD family transcriptional regulator
MRDTHVRFCRSFDGTRIAFAVSGRGPPVVLLPSWLTHLEFQPRSIAWRPWIEALSSRYTLVRYDPRGCGLSDRNVRNLSFDAWVLDLQAVVDGLGLDRFSLIGACQGGAVAMAWAGINAHRIERLVLYGTYARGRDRRSDIPMEPEKARVMLEMIELGWGEADHAFPRAFATQFQPEGGMDHLESWCALQRAAATGREAARLTRIMYGIDVTGSAGRIECPTLVVHASRDAVVPVEEGRLLARLIPGARFVELDTPNHFPLVEEPAWSRLEEAMVDFLPRTTGGSAFGDLTAREREILDLVAAGLSNAEIAGRLGLGEKTVRNHVSAVFAKTGASSRARAIVLAREAGFGTGSART